MDSENTPEISLMTVTQRPCANSKSQGEIILVIIITIHLIMMHFSFPKNEYSTSSAE